MSVDVGTSKGCSTSAMEEAAGGIGEAAWGTESGLDDSGDQDTLILGDATSNDPIDLIRGYCKADRKLQSTPASNEVWSQLENTRDAIRQETEYPLFPLAFAIHDARNRTKVATSVTEKKAVLTRLIPALTRSESVKKGEAEKCRHFTRCNVVKCYTGDASYQYIDDDLGKVLVSAEYERRYHLYLDSVCVDRDRAAACTSSKAPEKTNVRSSEIKLGCCGGGRKSEVAAAAVFIDKENALSMNGAAEEKGTSRGEEKTGLGGLRQAMWANLNALSLNGSGDNRNRGEVLHQQKPRPPPARGLNIPDPSSPKKEGKLTGRGRDINGSQGVAEIKADSGDHEGEGGGLFRLQIDVGVGCDDGACGMSSPAEIPY